MLWLEKLASGILNNYAYLIGQFYNLLKQLLKCKCVLSLFRAAIVAQKQR